MTKLPFLYLPFFSSSGSNVDKQFAPLISFLGLPVDVNVIMITFDERVFLSILFAQENIT